MSKLDPYEVLDKVLDIMNKGEKEDKPVKIIRLPEEEYDALCNHPAFITDINIIIFNTLILKEK